MRWQRTQRVMFLGLIILAVLAVAGTAWASEGHGETAATMAGPVGHSHDTDPVAGQVIDGLISGFTGFVYITLAAMLPLLWVLSLLVQAGRPLTLRQLRKFHLRFGADVWRLLYVMIRDAVLILTFVISVFLFFADQVLQLALPIMGPAATVLLLAALAIKLLGRSDDSAAQYRLVTGLISAGALVYLVPFLLGIEAPMEGWERWRDLASTSTNPGAAIWILYASMVSLFVICGYLFLAVLCGVTRNPDTAPGKAASVQSAGD